MKIRDNWGRVPVVPKGTTGDTSAQIQECYENLLDMF